RFYSTSWVLETSLIISCWLAFTSYEWATAIRFGPRSSGLSKGKAAFWLGVGQHQHFELGRALATSRSGSSCPTRSYLREVRSSGSRNACVATGPSRASLWRRSTFQVRHGGFWTHHYLAREQRF